MDDLEALVAAYVRHTLTRDPADFWAWDRAIAIVSGEDAELGFELLQQLVRAIPDDFLTYVGAGPVEEFVRHHGAALVDWLVGEAERDPRFRAALASIWLETEDLPSEVIQRLQAATGGEIKVSSRVDSTEEAAHIPPSEPSDDE